MTIWFVSRHPGAIEWARRQGLRIDRQVAHFDPRLTAPGDTVIGTLPVNLAALVYQHGGTYFNLSIDLPAEARGQELSADQLEAYGARLERYVVESLPKSMPISSRTSP